MAKEVFWVFGASHIGIVKQGILYLIQFSRVYFGPCTVSLISIKPDQFVRISWSIQHLIHVEMLKPIQRKDMIHFVPNITCITLFSESKESKCTEKCKHYAKCHTFSNGTSKCMCQLGCGRNLDPVCASDGKSYDNLCIMKREACLKKADFVVD